MNIHFSGGHAGRQITRAMHRACLFGAAALLLMAHNQAAAAAKEERTKPNVVLIIADDLGHNDVSVNGNPLVRTPHIDSIAQNGIRFLAGYSSNAVCSPARAALMTGRFQQRFGFEYTPFLPALRNATRDIASEDQYDKVDVKEPLPGKEDTGLPASEITIAQLLKQQGYSTALVGKWHLGQGERFSPLKFGFDEFVGYPTGASLFAEENDPGIVNAKLPWSTHDQYLWKNLKHMIMRGAAYEPAKGYSTFQLRDEAVSFIDRNAETPFFLYLAFTAPHTPLQAPKANYDRLAHITDHKTRVYYAMIEAMDEAVGSVIAELKKKGVYDNTIIIFSSDNGGAWYNHIPQMNLPYRGWKGTFFEGGVNVPYFIQWPAHIPAGAVIEGPASQLDILPTVVRAAGGEVPADRKIDGIDLMPRMKPGTTDLADRTLFWRVDTYKVIRKGKYKLHVDERQKKTWLYDLEIDPTERINIAEKMPKLAREMRDALNAVNAEMAAPGWPSTTRAHRYIDVVSPPYRDGEDYVLFAN